MQGADEVEQEHGNILAYFQCLKNNRHFRLLWLAEAVDNIGSWLNYVATLTLVQHFSNRSLAISAVVLIRFFPSLLLAPLCGVVADRCNRVHVLLAAALLDAAVVASLALVRRQWQLYALVTAQFTCTAFYEPARKALIPLTVPRSQLHLATTIDSFAWSMTGAVGASVGGVLASRLGNAACFLLDSLTYVIAAWCAYQLPRSLGRPGGGAADGGALGDVPIPGSPKEKKRQSDRVLELAPMDIDGELEAGEAAGGGSLGGEAAWLLPAGEAAHGATGPSHPTKSGRRHVGAAGAAALEGPQGERPPAGGRQGRPPKLKSSDLEEVPQPQGQHGPHCIGGGPLAAAALEPLDLVPEPAGQSVGGVLRAAAWATREAVHAAWEGWQYVSGRENRDVAALVSIKCSASVVWGAVEVLNVRFSQMESMQQWGDASVTLGLIYGTVATGCCLGPLVLNAVVAPRPRPLAWGVAAAFGFMLLGFLLILLAPSIVLLLLSTFVRAIGSASLWIYSTLLLQLRVPNAILGRMSALEMALFTVTEAASSVFGGAAFDVLGLSLRQTLAVLTLLAGVMFGVWVAFAAAYGRREMGGSRGGDELAGKQGYTAVVADDADGA